MAQLRVMQALQELDVNAPQIRAAFERAISALPDIPYASLVHADLYFDNVLVHEGSAVCLLDFEHACYADRFADFGKMRELLFECGRAPRRRLWPPTGATALRRRGLRRGCG